MNKPPAPPWITLTEVWLAYRKAKKEAFRDNNCAHGIRFARFEQALEANLERIFLLVNDPGHPWATNLTLLGKSARVPKSITPADLDGDSHYCESDPVADWDRRHTTQRATVTLRTVIEPSVEYLVISSLWVLKVGEHFDRTLRDDQVFANRVRRKMPRLDDRKAVNWESHMLYKSYIWQYGQWKKRSLASTREELKKGRSLVAVALDITSFYDNVDPSFLLSKAYLKRMGVVLSRVEREFTKALVASMKTWRMSTSLHDDIGLPIGLPSSGLIANILLAPFDQEVVEGLQPAFYGRYVDDIFLTIPTDQSFRDGRAVAKWIASRVSWLVSEADGFRLNLPYSRKSTIRFGRQKQRIFQLKGESGLDVILPIEEHMRRQSSEHRLLPRLPTDEATMAEKALLVNHGAEVRSITFREADVVTLQRAGFAELLASFEQYAKVVNGEEWDSRREMFYSLVRRHLLGPIGFFDMYGYLPRVVGLMACCADWDQLASFVYDLRELKRRLTRTTSVSSSDADQVFTNLSKRIELAILKAIPEQASPSYGEAVKAMKRVRAFGQLEVRGITVQRLREYANMLLLADWSRSPFCEYLLRMGTRGLKAPPTLPPEIASGMHTDGIRACLKQMNCRGFGQDTWRALLMPTRPLPLSEITQRIGWRASLGLPAATRASNGRRDPWALYNMVLAVRGQRLPFWARPRPLKRQGLVVGNAVGESSAQKVGIAVANWLTSDSEWEGAARGKPVTTHERLDRMVDFINKVAGHKPLPSIIVMPELSIPRSFLQIIIPRLERSGISLIAGLEYAAPRGQSNKRLNQALVTRFVGAGFGSHQVLQTKNEPAWSERELLQRLVGASLQKPSQYPDVPVFGAKGLLFAVLICSDLGNPSFRTVHQGGIDALFCVEWNRDLPSFESIVEATTLDLHCFVVQANNRQFGDSRIRGPFKKPHMRDVVQLKGGAHDYFVVAEIDPTALRKFQSDALPDLSDSAEFKPFPVGFRISKRRRIP